MDLFDLQEFIAQNYPDKKAEYSFPVESHRIYEIVMTDGNPNPHHHVECRKCLVKVEGEKDKFYPIKPHRMTVTHDQMKLMLNENVLKA